MDLRWALLLAFLPLAGCTEPKAIPEPAVAAAPDPLGNVTELHWGLTGEPGDTALEIVFEMGDDNDCDFSVGSSTRTTNAGPDDVVMVSDGTGYGWASGGGGAVASFHAGPIDTRDVVGAGGESGGLAGFGGDFSGTVVLTYVGVGVHEWGENPFVDDAALGIDVDCDEPFSVVSASMGHAILLVDGEGLEGGVGGSVSSEASANVQDSASIEIAATRARAGMGSFGEQAGQVVLEHPGGSETWTLTPVTSADDGFVEGGPGTYRFTVDRSSAYFDAFWLTAFGLDGPHDLVPGLRNETVTDSPF